MKRLMIAGVALAALTGAAFGHGEETHGKSDEPPEMIENAFGETGDPEKVNRNVELVMSDEMTYTPNALTLKVGDTVRFVVRNAGEEMHEMVIGRRADLKKHAKLMIEFPDMEHEEPFMAHVPPGKSGEIIWKFSKAGAFEFGCLIPGHFDAGMRGTITVSH